MDLGLEGKAALVTGAGSQLGFGKGIAMVLAGEGCDIVVCDINLEGAEQTAAEIKSQGRKAIALQMDITDKADVDVKVKKALDDFGRIDILVNNAGGGHPPKPFAESDPSIWDKDIKLNLMGMMYCTRAVIPQMILRKNGEVINISSDGGINGVPGDASYGAAKAGVINFTVSLAEELADYGIKVNCIAPAMGATAFFTGFPSDFQERKEELSSTGKATTPEDMGRLVAFLASDVSVRIHGQCILLTNSLSAR